ncbi:MAG TPA: hypothetical protein VF838_06715 [Trebonia sp.]
MNANERDEIAASVAAHAELGPRYDDAVAEGLVERIGAEIDKRIDARLQGQQAQERDGQLPGYQGSPAYQGPVATAPARPVAVPPPARAPSRGSGLSGTILGLGSMGLGVGATSVVVSHHPGGVADVLMVLLIWVMIAVINVAHSQRR